MMSGQPRALAVFRRWVVTHRFAGDFVEAFGRASPGATPFDLRRVRAYLRHGKRHHCIISGTGRAGTSFLIQLLTRLGFDTGFTSDNLPLYGPARAGLETDIRQEDAPYIVKNPWLCDHIEDVLARSDIAIDHAIIPMRSIAAAAESRAYVERLSGVAHPTGSIPGGLWGTKDEEKQERVLLQKFYALLWPLVRQGVPVTLLAYPRLVQDPEYLYGRLKFLVSGVPFSEFQGAWREVVRPEWMHQFGREDVCAPPRHLLPDEDVPPLSPKPEEKTFQSLDKPSPAP